MMYGFAVVMLQTTQHEEISHVFQKKMSESQVISHDQAVTSMVSMVYNGRKYIFIFIIYKTIVDLCFSRHSVIEQ